MAHVQFTDEVVREYLLFRGFGGTLKALDADLKSDKDKGFRVDKILEQILQNIYNYDLVSLRETWNHLDTRLFSRLEQHFMSSIRKLENAVLKFYLVNASENNKQDKITEFFTKMTNDLIGQSEWKDWFVLPFIKNPEEHASFSVYFTRQWQDTLLVSLHNLLAAVYQCMQQPTLTSFEENTTKMAALQKENEILRKGYANLIANEEKPVDLPVAQGLDIITDDFYYISQEIKANESQAKLLKTIMRNIGSIPGSPKQTTKVPDQHLRSTHRKLSVKKTPPTKRSLSIDARPTHIKSRERDSSLDPSSSRISREVKKEMTSEPAQEGNFLFLSQEEYSEHKCQITGIKFNNQGSMFASIDIEGNIKVWSVSPTCKIVASFVSKNPLLCLDWVPNHERYIVCGTSVGAIGLYDTKEVKLIWEINMEYEVPGARIEDVACSPTDTSILTVVSGKLYIVDLKTRKVEKCINTNDDCICSRLNHNGQLAVIGLRNGCAQILDLRKNDVIETWSNHEGSTLQVEFASDYTLCYTLGEDNKICCRTLTQTKEAVSVLTIPDEIKIPVPHGRLFCLDDTGTFLLTVGINSGVIYKMLDNGLMKSLELGGHKAMITCVDWSFANQCATCVTASQDGKIKISTLLVETI